MLFCGVISLRLSLTENLFFIVIVARFFLRLSVNLLINCWRLEIE